MVVLPSLRARHLCSGQQASGGSGSVTWRGGVPSHSKLEPSGGVPHGVGGAAADGGVSLFPSPVGVNTRVPLIGIATLMARRLVAG